MFLKDILTGDNGLGSNKKVITIVCLISIVFMGFIDQLTSHKVDPNVFDMLVYLIMVSSGLSIADKKINDSLPEAQKLDTQTTTVNVTKVETVPEELK